MSGRKKKDNHSSYSDRYDYWYAPRPKAVIEVGTGIRGNRNYGTTWWGQQWLKAFTQISDANRLPRGRTYANNGSVRTIDIDNNDIHATVLGSSLYNIHIRIPAFSAAQQLQIAELVAEQPDLLARLLNRELPSALHDACTRAGIDIFPRRWRDFTSSCSCPDYASPCKHLAAVIYLLANEIDKNPFLVLGLHRFDLVEALKALGYAEASPTQGDVVPLSSLWQPASDALPLPEQSLASLAPLPDFSQMPECRELLLAILPEKPIFYPEGDFKAVFKKILTHVAKSAQQPTISDQPEQTLRYEQVEQVRFILDEHGALSAVLLSNAAQETLWNCVRMEELLIWLAGLPAGKLEQLAPAMRGLWLIWRFADACARHSAMVPQLLLLKEHLHTIRWLPALNQEGVREIWEALLPHLPSQAVQYQTAPTPSIATPADHPLAMVSVFLTHAVHQHHGLERIGTKVPILSLFIQSQPQRFDQFQTREYPAALSLWLNRFFLREKSVVPVLVVEEESELAAFSLRLAIDDNRVALRPTVPLREVLTLPQYADIRLDLLRDLNTLADFFPDLRQLLQKKGKDALTYPARDFAKVLFEKLPLIRLFGLRVLLPKTLSKILRPRLSLQMGKNAGSVLGQSWLSLGNLLNYRWQVAIGDAYMSPEEFLKLLKNAAGLVKINGEYVYFDDKEVKALAEKLANPAELSTNELLQAAFSESYNGTQIQLTNELRDLIAELTRIETVPLPTGLQAQLRPYQHRGYSWLVKNAHLGFGSILADDMGLGKTLQVLTTLLHFKEDGIVSSQKKALIVAPTTLLTNWEREAARFTPDLRTAIYHGGTRKMTDTQEADVVFTSYGVARSDESTLSKKQWAVLVIDEAQNIKNPTAAQSKAIKKIPAMARIAMSGTPVENRLSEYWSVFDFSNHGYLGGLKQFKTNYILPIEGERDRAALQRFQQVTTPFVLRRLKTDKTIINDLPDKVEQNQYCTLSAEQAALYQSIVDKSLQEIEENEGIVRQGLVLQMILALKQICNHPKQFLKKGKSDPALSGKCPLLLDLVGQALENDEKVLIFTQFREMGELLAPMIGEAHGLAVPFLHGGVSRANRDKMVADFQQQRSSRVLLVSLKAGGTGLNLTAASQVIHFDLWWNPAVEAQATDRAFRIGQKRNVQVHRFITSNTFEERINAMIQAKRELADLTVTSGETWIGNLSNRELQSLFRMK